MISLTTWPQNIRLIGRDKSAITFALIFQCFQFHLSTHKTCSKEIGEPLEQFLRGQKQKDISPLNYFSFTRYFLNYVCLCTYLLVLNLFVTCNYIRDILCLFLIQCFPLGELKSGIHRDFPSFYSHNGNLSWVKQYPNIFLVSISPKPIE